MRHLIAIVYLAIFALVSSCGYRFVSKGKSAAVSIKSVYVANVENLTDEPNLDLYFRRDLIDRLNLDSRVKVVESASEAEGVLEAKIVSYEISPSAYTSSGIASLFRCSVEALVSLRKGNEYLIRDLRVEAYKNYRATDTVEATELARKVICKEILRDLANRVDEELFLGF